MELQHLGQAASPETQVRESEKTGLNMGAKVFDASWSARGIRQGRGVDLARLVKGNKGYGVDCNNR